MHDGQDTTTPQGKLLFSIMAGLAEFYSDILSENVQDGMARAKAQGKHLGRPRIPDDIKYKIQRLRAQEPPVSPRQISKLLEIGYGTARRYVKTLEE